ncbi:tetratricopeptide repeat protein [Loktanella sp. DSM 29012]|uniref:tetratricopeptide repeat protein n=1 Tax=Loktanella sp. DSM 29012 TaxID=1881056 RepID=UPI000B7F1D2E|nr:tetratricopeptide repeat protein [Loktanella sp. DSM 29012]
MTRSHLFALALTVALPLSIEPASSQTVVEATVTVSEAERQVLVALAASNATLEATRRQSDRALRRKLFEIEDLQARIEELMVGDTAAAQQIETLRNQLAEQQQRFIDELAAQDEAYSQEIASYRRAVEDIASTPEGLAALQRFNAGEEAEALQVLDRLRAARDLAAARRIAQLALDAWRRAKVTTVSVIARYEEITQIDPSVHWDWVELRRLYFAAGNLSDALAAARESERTAKTDRDRSVALNELGDVLVAQGDLPSALQSYRRGLEIRERLADADPGNAGWHRDLSVSLNKVGDVLVAQGDLPSALQSYRRGLEIRERLADADPGNAGWQRDLSVSLNKVGDVLVAQGDLPSALQSYRRGLEIRERLADADPGNAGWQRDVSVSLERVGDVLVAQGNLPSALQSYRRGLEIAERLADADPGNAGWQRDVSVSLNKVGDVLVAQGDLPSALQSYRRGLEIRERLADADPGNAGWQRDVSVSLNKVGDVQVAQGDRPSALQSYRRGLEIAERLAEADPGNAGWQRDVWVSLWRIRRFPNSGIGWADVVERMEEMDRRGVLIPTDRVYLEQARQGQQAEAH